MRIGLALSGGAARGLAHLGVLKALTAANIPIDCVAGCSAGSVLGAMYCAGLPLDLMQSYLPSVTWRRIARLAYSSRGLLTFDKLERLMIMLLGDIEFRDLQLPFAAATVDIVTGERVIVREGRLAPAVRASCSIPGFVIPKELDGRLLADGGVVDNLPVDAALALGADYVIGVDVLEPSYRRGLGVLGKGLTAVETLVRNAGGGVQQADFLITPRTAGYSYADFSHHKQLVTLGWQAAQESLPELKRSIAARRAS